MNVMLTSLCSGRSQFPLTRKSVKVLQSLDSGMKVRHWTGIECGKSWPMHLFEFKSVYTLSKPPAFGEWDQILNLGILIWFLTELNCLVLGDLQNNIFKVLIEKTMSVGDRKKAIMEEKQPALDHLPSDQLGRVTYDWRTFEGTYGDSVSLRTSGTGMYLAPSSGKPLHHDASPGDKEISTFLVPQQFDQTDAYTHSTALSACLWSLTLFWTCSRRQSIICHPRITRKYWPGNSGNIWAFEEHSLNRVQFCANVVAHAEAVCCDSSMLLSEFAYHPFLAHEGWQAIPQEK